MKYIIFTGLLTTLISAFPLISAGQQWLYFPTGIPKNWLNIGNLNVPGSTITVEALISLKDLSTNPAKNIVSKHTGFVNCNYLLRHWRFEMTTTSGYTSLTNPVSLCVDSIYHVAATYDGEHVRYFLNGSEVASSHWTGTLIQNSLATAIGNISADGPNEQFFGYIDEVRIWNVARTQSEIAYNMYDLPDPTNQTGLLAYYKFEGNYINSQGNPAYDGTPVGSQMMRTTNPNFTGTVSGPRVQVSITITASANPVCAGTLVNYTATPQNGGDFPLFQWKVNGINIGTGGQTFSYIPLNGDVVTCVLNSSLGCTLNNPATSNALTMTVEDNMQAGITIAASANPVCSGTPVNYNASPVNGGSNPSYQWQVNGINTGTNSPSFVYNPTNGDVISCLLYSSLTGCLINNPATSNAIAMTVNPNLQVSISIEASQNPVCAGNSVSFTATPVNQGSSPVYQWKVNGVISGTNDPVFNYIPSNGDHVSCTLTSSIAECVLNNPASSNSIFMVVENNLPVSVSIEASINPLCEGDPVTIHATTVNGGTSPGYQWRVNNIITGTNSPDFIYIPLNGDNVTCTLTSDLPCTIDNPKLSNTVILTTITRLQAGVQIVADNNPFCGGTTVTFTATPLNGGSSPSFQWNVNEIVAGNNSPQFSYSAQSGDIIKCIMTSDLFCSYNNPAISNEITMTGLPVPSVSLENCYDNITSINAKPFRLKGGLPLGGDYSGPGVDPLTGIFNPAQAGPGTKNIKYTYTNFYSCSSSDEKPILVLPASSFTCGNDLTDIRDGKVYSTVKIGLKCWMGDNLNYGTWISSNNPQTDNCIPEKYCTHDAETSCQSGTATYQWDELIQYGITSPPEYQGLCPPGWHIPSAAEFQSLIDLNQGNGRAGVFLTDLYLIPRGFEAPLKGMSYMNTSWSFTSDDVPAGTFYWTSTPGSSNRIITRGMNSRKQSVSMYETIKANAFPVRCVLD